MLPDFLKKLFGRSPRTTRSEFRTLIDWNAFDTMLERSPVPAILVMVLVWAVSTTALFLSGQNQRDPKNWQLGEKAPFPIYARSDFSYVDSEATQKAADEAEATAPEVFRVDRERSQEIKRNFNDFVEYVKIRLDNRKAKRLHGVVMDSVPAQVAAEIPLSLCEAIIREQNRGTTYAAFSRQLAKGVRFGILGNHERSSSYHGRIVKLKDKEPVGVTGKEKKTDREDRGRYEKEADKELSAPLMVRVFDENDRVRKQLRRLDEFPSPGMAAVLLANTLFPDDETCSAQFSEAALKLIGEEGNLSRDDDRTAEAQENAKKAVKADPINKKKDDLLIAQGETFTRKILDMIEAERETVQRPNLRPAIMMIVWSFLLLVAAIALQYWLNPRCLGDNRSIIVIGLTVIIAVALNYLSIRIFEYLFSLDKLKNRDLAIAVVPVALAPAMISVMLDRRTAIGTGIYIAAITAMMIMPDRSFELALRWSAVTTVTALLVSRVNNYRTFFMYTLGASIVMTALICLGLSSGSAAVTTVADNAAAGGETAAAAAAFIRKAVNTVMPVANNAAVFAKVILCSGFAAAMLSLTLIFLFEVVGNQSTSMSMMVLCDCNHPLLERMKREAPGTMAHSMAVATLSEDAARAIGANALTAKAGALFHDIGKLVMPQYFTENNPDSALQHLNLNPQMSSIIIRDHVKEGLQLARSYRLCREVRDIIGTHHGDDLVRYFYNKMLENAKQDGAAPPVLESQFRYNGEPPRGIEATIVSLADACEAASRSLEHPTPERIRELVDRIILGRFQGGQLRRSRLPLADLEKIRDSFVATLSSSRHGRVSYDTQAQTEEKGPRSETALPVAESATPESRQK